jgi:hypothetical protein
LPSASPKPPGSRKSRCMSMIDQRRARELDRDRPGLGVDQRLARRGTREGSGDGRHRQWVRTRALVIRKNQTRRLFSPTALADSSGYLRIGLRAGNCGGQLRRAKPVRPRIAGATVRRRGRLTRGRRKNMMSVILVIQAHEPHSEQPQGRHARPHRRGGGARHSPRRIRGRSRGGRDEGSRAHPRWLLRPLRLARRTAGRGAGACGPGRALPRSPGPPRRGEARV